MAQKPLESTSKMTLVDESFPAQSTKVDQELDTRALELGWDNRENVWSATARFLRAVSIFSRALWAWLNHPVIALLAGIVANVVLVCVLTRPGGSWKSAALVVSDQANDCEIGRQYRLMVGSVTLRGWISNCLAVVLRLGPGH